jgi:type I restriction enzyme, S subunit
MSFEEWKETTAENFCFKVTDGTHDSPKKVLDGKYLITSRHLKGFELDLQNAYLISNEDFTKINERSKVDQWDILFSMIGTVGEVYLERNSEINYTIKNVGLFKFNGDKLRAKWFYYFLKSKHSQEYIYANLRGSTQQYLTLGALRKFPVFYPKNEIEMKKIINILDSLDQKIQLNNQINKNLEEMAQAIFKSWFIDFEPFQDGEFVESELGLIPKGWEVKQIGNVCTVVGGGTPKTKVAEYWEGGDILWATPSDMTSKNCPVIYNTSRKITQEGLNNSAAKLLPSGSVIMTSRATIGYSAITMKELCTNQGFINVVCNKDISSYYMLFYLKHSKDKIIGLANGSTFLEISRKVFKEIDIVVPPKHILEKFNEIVEPIIQSIYQFEVEIQKLTNLRDTLLPKLMSGEIRVPLENEGRHQDEQLQRV